MPTPPAYVNPPVLPYIGTARTYIAENLTGVTPSFPIPYSEDPNSAYYKMVKDLYNTSKNLTVDEQNTALYWVALAMVSVIRRPGMICT